MKIQKDLSDKILNRYLELKNKNLHNKGQIQKMLRQEFKLPKTTTFDHSVGRYRNSRSVEVNDKVTTNVVNEVVNKPKILFFDIETFANLAYVWGKYDQNVIDYEREWFVLCFCYKWYDDDTVFSYSLPEFDLYQKDRTNDYEVVKQMWHLFDEADVVVAHNGDCVSIDTPVLTTNLRWINAGDLKEGDKLVGFDENNSKNSPRKIKESTVLSHRIENRPALKVTFDNGDEIITTHNHPWLKLSANGRDYQWCESKNLKLGQRVEKFFTPWKDDLSYEAGWLSGFISGEGTLKKGGNSFSIDFCQRPGVTLDKAIDYSNKLNIKLAPLKTKIGGLGKGDTQYTYIHGSKFNTLQVLGELQINRLIGNIDWDNVGYLKSKTSSTATIISIEEVGEKPMAIMTTSSKTYFAGGYPMHNSFDIKKMFARFLYHGFPPPSPFKSIDTKKVAKRYFNMNSNKLDDIGRYLGVGRKRVNTGWDLWRRCFDGDENAWGEMLDYNAQDVILLEKIYEKFKPYMQNHPNFNLYAHTKLCCPNCGSDNLQKRGYAYSRVNKVQRYQCRSCYAWSSGNKLVR